MTGVRQIPVLAVILAAGLILPGWAQEQPSAADESGHDHGAPAASAPIKDHKRVSAPADAYVYIGWPNDGEVIRSTRFKIWFGTRNFGIAPAGVNKPNTGHHHLLIDTALPAMDEPIPNNKNHRHFGLGQTEAVIELPPGTHTLQLLMGDAEHVPHDPPLMSKKITITIRPAHGSGVEAHAPSG
jgi:Domain of unknown function (DUF4399)